MIRSYFFAAGKRLFWRLPPFAQSTLRMGLRSLASRDGVLASRDARRALLGPASTLGELVADRASESPRSALDLTGARLLTYGYYARLELILRRLDIDLALDAGAHEGQFGSQLCGFCGFRSPLVSFEPVTRFHAKLKAMAAVHPNWRAENLAVGSSDGGAVIRIGGGHGGTSSLLEATEALTAYAPDAGLGAPESINVVRLDTYLERNFPSLPSRIFLKLDVQGFEEQAFLSAGRFMPNIALVQAELASVEFYKGQKGFGAMCQMFAEHGFEPILVHNNFGIENAAFVDFDVLFCRAELMPEATGIVQ